MIRSLFAMMDSEHRVRSQGVLTARFLMPMATWPSDTARREFCDRVLPLVRSLPGIQSASIVTPLPLNNENSDTRIVAETGKYTDRERPLRTNYTECYPEFFATLGIPVVDGRDFTHDDGPGAPSVVIVNQSLARALWPRENPLGRRLQTISDQRKLGWRTVVGVVPDIPQDLENTTNRLDNAMFVPHRQEPDQYLTWVLHTEGDPLSLAAPLRELLRGQAPDVPLTEVRTGSSARSWRCSR
jgi:hypothetical protein